MSEEKVWGIHTRDDRLFLEDNVIAIGWHEIGDLSLIGNKESLLKKYTERFIRRRQKITSRIVRVLCSDLPLK